MATEQDREFLKQLAGFKPPESVAELRAALDTFAPMLNADAPEIGALAKDVELRPRLAADIAVPKGAGPFPVIVYLHGGGWVAGSPRTHRKLAMQFAERGYLCINVDYRLAPENPFPAPLDDCVFAIKWAGRNAARWNGDARRIAVGGDSAGGNLTAAAPAAERGALGLQFILHEAESRQHHPLPQRLARQSTKRKPQLSRRALLFLRLLASLPHGGSPPYRTVPYGMPDGSAGQYVACYCDSSSYLTSACKIGTDLGYPWTFEGPTYENSFNYVPLCTGRNPGDNIVGGWFTSGTDPYNQTCIENPPYEDTYTCGAGYNIYSAAQVSPLGSA